MTTFTDCRVKFTYFMSETFDSMAELVDCMVKFANSMARIVDCVAKFSSFMAKFAHCFRTLMV